MPIMRTLAQRIYNNLSRIPDDVLNSIAPEPSSPPPLEALDVLLKKSTARIKAEAIDNARGLVDYARLRDTESYHAYRQLTVQLNSFDLATLIAREQKLAFWINLYNALVIDAIIHYRIRHSVNEVRGFFRRAAYQIGGLRFSLNDIEHGILRANAGHPAIAAPQFTENDPRRAYCLPHLDYRVHFALVCGALSCPPIQFYDANIIDSQLDLAMRGFLAQSVSIDPLKRRVTLSKLLQWYGADFGAGAWIKIGWGDRRLILRAIAPYAADDITRALFMAHDVKVRFAPYDWSLNGL